MTSNLLRSKFRLLDGWTIINRRNPKIAVNASVLSIIKRDYKPSVASTSAVFVGACWLARCVKPNR